MDEYTWFHNDGNIIEQDYRREREFYGTELTILILQKKELDQYFALRAGYAWDCSDPNIKLAREIDNEIASLKSRLHIN